MTSGSTETVFITGGADSVGRVMAERFHDAGARVFICDIRAPTLTETLEANPGMLGQQADAGDKAQLDAAIGAALDELGAISVLINNVGIGGPRAPLEAIDDEAWEQVLAVNLTAAFRLMRAVVPGMKRAGRGLILNFSSGSTRTRLPLRTPYVVSKFAIEGLTLNAARELGPHNIRCNAILPGMINNARMQGIVAANARAAGRSEAEIEAEYLQYVSMRTKIEPNELAEMAFFLASSAATHVTGELISVSGNVEWEI